MLKEQITIRGRYSARWRLEFWNRRRRRGSYCAHDQAVGDPSAAGLVSTWL